MSAFDDKENKDPKVTIRGPKTQSIFDNVPKKPTQTQFEQKAIEINDRLNSYPERSAELVPLFMKLLNSEILSENKGSIDADIEKDIINKLMQLGIDMNEDQYEKAGAGSIGLNVLLMKCVLTQRDKINDLKYAVSQIKTEIKKIKTQIISTPLDNKLNDK